MLPILDVFQILIRRCRPLDSEGFELTVELRRKLPNSFPGTPAATKGEEPVPSIREEASHVVG